MGKSPELHAEVQQFKSHSGHNFFFYPVATHIPISDRFSTYLVNYKPSSYTLQYPSEKRCIFSSVPCRSGGVVRPAFFRAIAVSAFVPFRSSTGARALTVFVPFRQVLAD